MLRLITGIRGPSGFGSASTAENVTDGIDATNITAIITGGASGIGLETARVLALRNAHVIIGARNMESANQSKQLILKKHKHARVDVLKLDLASFESIKDFADKFLALNLPLNILINNAGIMFCPYQLSSDGIELQFATNHIGHFYLTNLLLDRMKQTANASGVEGRIVNLSSVAHVYYSYKGGIMFGKINDINSYDEKRAYGQSKLANILHANELSQRLKAEGANITINSVHPGLIMTNLFKHSGVCMKIFRFVCCFMWKNIAQGAATTCYVALHPSLKGISGKYFMDCNEFKPNRFARNQLLAKNMWDFSENLTNPAQN
ncbi:short-chain dehydrogenase TIC 32 B, chloroplastic-like [Henckelia pumila]|uniref:short-chain dehydrogenase TIC 32 B, chloroplastic-like n=1 Tax=Henckelia pumila TaxID=405737 RepID=UPI003C6DD39C